MAPSFFSFKELRRRSRASFRTERSTTDSSSEASHGTTPTSGSLTPPSITALSDPALNLQLKDDHHPQHHHLLSSPSTSTLQRPAPQPCPGGNPNRHSVSGMAGLGAPVPHGRGPTLPVSQYSPRITNVADNSWVSGCGKAASQGRRTAHGASPGCCARVVVGKGTQLTRIARCTKK